MVANVQAQIADPGKQNGRIERLRDLVSLMRSYPNCRISGAVIAAIQEIIDSGKYMVLQ